MAGIDDVKRENLTARSKRSMTISCARGHAELHRSVLGLDPHARHRRASRPAGQLLSRPSKLDKRLLELIILMMCRDATVKYPGPCTSRSPSRGLTRTRSTPFAPASGRISSATTSEVIYDFVTELAATKTVSAATFDRAKAAFGLEGVIEAVTCAGFLA